MTQILPDTALPPPLPPQRRSARSARNDAATVSAIANQAAPATDRVTLSGHSPDAGLLSPVLVLNRVPPQIPDVQAGRTSMTDVAAFTQMGAKAGARLRHFDNHAMSSRQSNRGLLLAYALATQIAPPDYHIPAQGYAPSASTLHGLRQSMASDRFVDHLNTFNRNTANNIDQALKQWDYQQCIDSAGTAIDQLPSGLQRLRDLPAWLAVQNATTRLLLDMPQGSASIWVDHSKPQPKFGLVDPALGVIEDIRDHATLNDILAQHFSQSYAANDMITVRTLTNEAAASLADTYPASELLGQKHYSARDLLALQDRRDGMLRIGNQDIARVALHDMGAMLNGKPIQPGSLEKHIKKGTLADRISFDAKSIQQRIRSLSDDVTPEKIQHMANRTQSIKNLGGDRGVIYQGIVFRGDMRAPEVVFKEGFKLRTPINHISEVNGTRGGFGGGHDALDPDGRGISTSAFYQRSGAGAYYYGGNKGGFTYVIDGTALEGFHLYANDHLKKHPGDTKVRLPPSEINYGADIPRHAVIGAFDRNGKYIASPLAIAGKNLRSQFKTAGGDDQVSNLLFDLGTARTIQAPLITDADGSVGKWVKQMNDALARAAKTGARVKQGATQFKHNLFTYLLPGGGAVSHTGVGLQAFGIYNSIRGIRDAVARGDATDIAINNAGLAAEGLSLGAEKGIAALGNYLQKGSLASFNAFSRTSIGSKLGGTHALGTNIGRTASGVGVLITTPFDIYSAYSSFSQAANSHGKSAQDHYVNGALAVTGAASSIALAGAAFAGVAAAGPIGIAVGAALALGGGIYSSARYVEDLDTYANLSDWEKFVTGVASFVGSGASQDIEDRAAISKARENYDSGKQQLLQAFLKQSTQYGEAIFGNAIIKARPPLTEPGTTNMHGLRKKTVTQRPALVTDNGADHIDARHGTAHVKTRVSTPAANGDAVYWATGDGHDRLSGVDWRSNTFDLGQGKKEVHGGWKNDRIRLTAGVAHGSHFNGGDGDDTLDLSAVATASGAGTRRSFVVKLPATNATEAVSAELFWQDNVLRTQGSPKVRRVETASGHVATRGHRATLDSVENVITAKNARTKITGNDKDNLFILNGRNDSVIGGDGNDIYVINGGGTVQIAAGNGDNRYQITRKANIIEIATAPHSASTELNLAWNLDEITVQAIDGNLEILLGRKQQKKKLLQDVSHTVSGQWAASQQTVRVVDGKREVLLTREHQKKIRLPDAFHQTASGQWQARQPDGALKILTRDGYLLTPVLSSRASVENGLLRIIASISPHRLSTSAA